MKRMLAAALTLSVLSSLALPAWSTLANSPEEQASTVSVEWLGWNAWRVTSPTGKVLLLNPFVNNPDSVIGVDGITQADLILVTNGHGDEVGQTFQIAENTGARIIPGSFGFGTWFTEQGVPSAQVSRVNPGDWVMVDGITIRVVHGIHGSDISARRSAGDPFSSMGIAGAFFITFENGWTLYYGGSSAATQDQGMWAQMYRPHAAILNLSDDRDPMDFGMQVKLLMTDNPNLDRIYPGHLRAQQVAANVRGAHEAMNAMGIRLRVSERMPGQVDTFSR